MKKVIFAIVAGVMSFGAVNAVSAQRLDAPVAQDQADEKVKIKVEELPDAIKTALASDSYKGWSADAAFYNKTKDSYEVQVKKGTETKTLKFSKDGNIIE
jgi:ribosomal protein L21E